MSSSIGTDFRLRHQPTHLEEGAPVGLRELVAVDDHEDVQHQQAQAVQGKAHDGTGAEGSVEAVLEALTLGVDGGTGVGVHRNSHTNVTG
jgi:hypothetical protein